MLRIPGSINSKNGKTVSIIKKWDQSRPEINYLLAAFRRFIINEKYTELVKAEKRRKSPTITNGNSGNHIGWIERLLQAPLPDHRKYCIWRILAPYLVNIRNLLERDATNIITEWLNRCNQVRKLAFNYNQRIKNAIEGSAAGYLPISREN